MFKKRPVAIVFSLLLSVIPLLSQPSLAQTASSASAGSGPSAKRDLGAKGQEVVAWRTRTSRTYNENGVYRSVVYPGSINYQDAQGAWQPIDDTLVPSSVASYAYQNKANRYTVLFPSDLSQAPIRIQLKNSWISFSLRGASGAGTVSGDTDSFSLPGATLAYTAGNDGLKESLTLQGPDSPHSFQFDLSTSPDLTVTQNADGGVDFTDHTGRVVFSFAPPFMEDNSKLPSGISRAVTFSLDQTGNGETVTLAADSAWLADPVRAWPVVIDPSVSFPDESRAGNPSQDCNLWSGAATTSYCNQTYEDVGLNGTNMGRDALLFTVPSQIYIDSEVVSAQLSMTIDDASAYMSNASTTLSLYPMTRAWTTSATWNSYDGTNAWSRAGGDYAANTNPPTTVSATISKGETGTVSWYPTQIAQEWTDGTLANDGLLLRGAETLSDSNLVLFYGMSGTTSTQWPQLTIWFEPRMGDRAFYPMAFSQTLFGGTDLSVDGANGNLLVHTSDVSIPGEGSPLTIDRYYNNFCVHPAPASGTIVSDLGSACWTFSTGWDVGLQFAPDGSAVFSGPSGYKVPFNLSGGSFTPPPGIDAQLVKNGDGTYTMTFDASQEKYNFSASGTLTSDVDRSGNTIKFAYNSADGSLQSITDTQGDVLSVTQQTNSGGQNIGIQQFTDVFGRTHTYGYNTSNGDLTSYTDPAGDVTTYGYGTGNFLTQIKDPDGNLTNISYNGANEVSQITRVTNTSTGAGYSWTFTYNSGNTVVTDPNGHATTYYFNGQGQATSVTDAASHTTSATWTGDDQPQTTTDGKSFTTQYGYVNGNVSPSFTGTPTLNTSTTCSQSSTPTECLTGKATYGNTAPASLYSPSATTDAQGNTTTYQYDSAGRVTSATAPLTASTSATTGYTYNADGTMASKTDANNHTTNYSYYCVTSGAGCPGGYTKGLLDQVTDPLSRVTTYTYTNTGTNSSYNQPATVKDANGQTATYSYDKDGRVTAIAYTNKDGSAGPSIGYSYDADGNLLAMTDATGTTDYYYDALNREISEILPGKSSACTDSAGHAATICYGFDGVGNLTSETDAGGQVSYAYNADDTLHSLTDPAGTTNFGYDADQQRTSIQFPNGITESMSYDGAGDLTKIAATGCTTGTCPSSTYTYTTSSGQATSLRHCVTNAAGTITQYNYDLSNRLSSVWTVGSCGATSALTTPYSYTYDANGNITQTVVNGTTTTLTYDAANEMTASGSNTFSYDSDGNETGTSSGYALTYNAENQTTSIKPSGTTTVTNLGYTGQGQTQRITRGSDTFQNDASGIDTASIGGTTAYYTRTPDGQLIDERIPSGTSAGTYYYLADGLNSVVALANSSGGIANTYSYDPYGKPSQTGSVPNPYEWISGVYDSFTGWYQLGARYYRPVVGSFTQADPNTCLATNDPYQYSDDDPVNETDLTGMSEKAGPVQYPEGGPPPGAGAFDPLGGLADLIGSLFSSGGRWHCQAKCQLGSGGRYVYGLGYGKTQVEACANAKRDAGRRAGAYVRHCRCFNCSNR
ncbi:MAG TPA: DNRLRE domain-containing protein [Chloroflexota bacterium]|nr:DNRLRE domain-containing protein [Chloroflexota bacterium]